jgi:hypothetical protein
MWCETAACDKPTDSSMSQAHNPGSSRAIRSQQDRPLAFSRFKIFNRVGSASALKAMTVGSSFTK